MPKLCDTASTGSDLAKWVGKGESLTLCAGGATVAGNLNGREDTVCGGINPEALAGFNVGATDKVPSGVVGAGHVVRLN